jgi:hypothetical protein
MKLNLRTHITIPAWVAGIAAAVSVGCGVLALQLSRVLFTVIRESDYEAARMVTGVATAVQSDSTGANQAVGTTDAASATAAARPPLEPSARQGHTRLTQACSTHATCVASVDHRKLVCTSPKQLYQEFACRLPLILLLLSTPCHHVWHHHHSPHISLLPLILNLPIVSLISDSLISDSLQRS